MTVRLKVLQLGKYYPPYNGGMETNLYNLCMDLKERVDLKVLVFNTDSKTLKECVEGVSVVRAGTLGKIFSTELSTVFFKECTGNYDIVHLHLPNPIASLAYFLRRPKGKLVLTWHSDIIKQKKMLKIYAPLQNWILKRADAIQVTSPQYLAFSKYLAQYKEKCTVIPLGIDIEQFKRTPQIDSKIEELQVQFPGPVILYVGRLVYYKGVEYLIRAMEHLNATLIIVGSGPLKSSLEMLAQERCAQRVVFLNEVDAQDLIALYYRADCFCLPSIEPSEAFGLVQAEAMACGKPVVSTEIGTGVSFVNAHKQSGFIVEPRNDKALTHALNEILSNNNLAKQLGIGAEKRVRELFTRQTAAEGIYRLYNKVMS